MVQKAHSLKVKIKTREKVKDIYQENGRWKVRTEGWTYEGDSGDTGEWFQCFTGSWF